MKRAPRKGEGRPCIYALSDKSGIRYIGQTKHPKRRESQHKSHSNNQSHRAVCHWLTSLLNAGETPIFSVLEETIDLDNREMFWIKHFSEKGIKLLNHNEGGKAVSHANRAKEKMPWRFSPLQRRLSDIRRVANFAKRQGDFTTANRFYGYLKFFNNKYKSSFVRSYINLSLWEKYGY